MRFIDKFVLVLDWLMTLATGDIWRPRLLAGPARPWPVVPDPTLVSRGMTLDESILLCVFCTQGNAGVQHEFHWYLGPRPMPPKMQGMLVVKVGWS